MAKLTRCHTLLGLLMLYITPQLWGQEAQARRIVDTYCRALSTWAKAPNGDFQFESKTYFSGVTTPVYDEYRQRDSQSADYFTDFGMMLMSAKAVDVRFSPIRELRLITGSAPTLDKTLEQTEYYCIVLDKETKVDIARPSRTPEQEVEIETKHYNTRNYIYVPKEKPQIYGILNKEKLSEVSSESMSAELAYLSAVKAYEDKNYPLAFRYFGIAKDKGHNKAAVKYALMLFYGQGTKKDRKQCASIMEHQAIQGNTEACYCMGIIYYTGKGVKADSSLAKEYFNKSASSPEWRARSAKFMLSVGMLQGIYNEVKNTF